MEDVLGTLPPLLHPQSISVCTMRQRLRRAFFVVIIVLTTFCRTNHANAIDVTGSWTGFSVVGSSQYANIFTLVQNGTQVTGTSFAGTPPVNAGTITGTINGNILTYRSDFPSINYSSNATATTDGITMSGTFLDSQGTSGTFTAINSRAPLTPATKIQDPPSVQVSGKTAVITLQSFSGITFKTTRNIHMSNRKTAQRIEYDVTLKGADRRRKSSTRNVVTFGKLPPGNYTVTYKVSALRNGQRVFTTRSSPAAGFVVGN